jgi:hypothetical protein
LSEYFKFHQRSQETEDEMNSLLRGIDLQICLMHIIRSQIESGLRAEHYRECKDWAVRESESRYGKSGYMADVELDDRGQISSIRYDWVEP